MRSILVLMTCLAAGCGPQEDIVIRDVDVSRSGWDSLIVSASFARNTSLNGLQRITPDERRIIVYDASYDTLYAGTDSVFSISDGELGNRERMMVELCGQVEKVVVCEQYPIQASPKRVLVEPDIEYPVRKAVYQGNYRLPFSFERLRYGTEDDWEPIERSSSPDGRIIAYVEGRENESVQFPFDDQRGGFNLAQNSNYQDFKFYLDSALLDHNEASVRFDIYVNMDGLEQPIASTVKAVSVLSDEEHQVEVARLAEEAAEQIVKRLNPFLNRRRNVVYIDGWNYNSFRQMYTVNLEIKWSGSLFARSDYELAGILEVYEDGARSSFRKSDGNRRAVNRWKSRIDGNVMTLDPLNQPALTHTQNSGASYHPEAGQIVLEAEHYDGARDYKGQSWSLQRDRRGARGNGAMAVLPDKNVRIRSGYDEKSPELTYSISFDEAGDYYIWLRVWAADENSNSVHMGLNGTAFRSSSAIETSTYRRWIWARKSADDGEYASIKVFSPGVRTLNLWMREDGIYVDRIILTRDKYYAPRGSGPDESRRTREENGSSLTATDR